MAQLQPTDPFDLAPSRPARDWIEVDAVGGGRGWLPVITAVACTPDPSTARWLIDVVQAFPRLHLVTLTRGPLELVDMAGIHKPDVALIDAAADGGELVIAARELAATPDDDESAVRCVVAQLEPVCGSPAAARHLADVLLAEMTG